MRPRLSVRDRCYLGLLTATLLTDAALLWAVTRRWWRM